MFGVFNLLNIPSGKHAFPDFCLFPNRPGTWVRAPSPVPPSCWQACAQKMSRLLVGVTLERICKAILLLCLLHFLIIMILYFDVYAQRLDFFSRFNARNTSRTLPYVNISRPNSTAGSLGPELLTPSTKSVSSNSTITEKPLPLCPEMPSGLGETTACSYWR